MIALEYSEERYLLSNGQDDLRKLLNFGNDDVYLRCGEYQDKSKMDLIKGAVRYINECLPRSASSTVRVKWDKQDPLITYKKEQPQYIEDIRFGVEFSNR